MNNAEMILATVATASSLLTIIAVSWSGRKIYKQAKEIDELHAILDGWEAPETHANIWRKVTLAGGAERYLEKVKGVYDGE